MSSQKQRALTSLKKARSLISRIIDMVEEDQYCIDIMQQNLAAIGLLRSTHAGLMQGHLKSCFRHAMESKDSQKKNQMIKEILQVTKLYNK